MGLVFHILVSTLAVLISTHLIPGASVDDLGTAIIVAIVLGVLNAFLKPFLKLISLPITILTLGLFSLVINLAIVLLAEYLVPGFDLATLLSAFLFSLALSILNAFFSRFGK